MEQDLNNMKIEYLIDLLADKTLALHELIQKRMDGEKMQTLKNEVKTIQDAIKQRSSYTNSN
jgi:hypothetical protein